MKNKLRIFILSIGLCLMTSFAFADDPDPWDDDSPDVPIDGGISLLLAAGVGYVIKKSRDKRLKERK